MASHTDLVRRYVALESYSSSRGFVGYTERTGAFDEHLCRRAVEALRTLYPTGLRDAALVTSLHVPSDLSILKEDYGLDQEAIDAHIRPLLADGIVTTVDYSVLGDDYDSPEYERQLNSLRDSLVCLEQPETGAWERACFTVMAVGAVVGHCFLVLGEHCLIVYPHDDTGFGFIFFGQNDEQARKVVLQAFSASEFQVKLSKTSAVGCGNDP